jgi:amino acid transporter
MNDKIMDNDKYDTGSLADVPNVAVLPVDEDGTSPMSDMDIRVAESLNHRKLNSRQVQLTSIAGSIGALLFVGIGSGLASGPIALIVGKPLSLLGEHSSD